MIVFVLVHGLITAHDPICQYANSLCLTSLCSKLSIIYGAGEEGPKIIESNGVARQLKVDWNEGVAGGVSYQKVRFSGLDLFANNTYADGAEVCFVMNKGFSDASCLGLDNLCKNGGRW